MLDNMLTPFYHVPVPLWAPVSYTHLGRVDKCAKSVYVDFAWRQRTFKPI